MACLGGNIRRACIIHCRCRLIHANRQLPGLSTVRFGDRRAILGLRSLQVRRHHEDLIFACKIIFGVVDLDCAKFFLVSPNETTRGHVGKLFARHSRVDVRKYFLGNCTWFCYFSKYTNTNVQIYRRKISRNIGHTLGGEIMYHGGPVAACCTFRRNSSAFGLPLLTADIYYTKS